MCSFMVAHHLCGHLHHWFARCHVARILDLDSCGLDYFAAWQFQEYFYCPPCRNGRRREAMALVRNPEGYARRNNKASECEGPSRGNGGDVQMA